MRLRRRTLALFSWAYLGSLLAGALAASPADADGGGSGGGLAAVPQLRFQYTEYIGQLTGTASNPLGPGMTGTDLGISFPVGNQLYFLFGDSWTDDFWRDYNLDSMATTSASRTSELPKLNWITGTDGRFRPFRLPNVNLEMMNLPVEGLSIGDRKYVFFHAGWDDNAKRATQSTLAYFTGADHAVLTPVHTVDSDKFLSVSVVQEGEDVYIFGAGHYRASALYLAHVQAHELDTRAAWTYYLGAGDTFGGTEADAVPLIDTACFGEISVRKHDVLGIYLMTYNCDVPETGLYLRVAEAPEGPWSEPIQIFNPAMGDQHFIHAVAAHDDGLSERDREGEPGAAYGPYLVPQWFREPGPGLHEIVYTVSSWNPYQVHLLRTLLAEPGYDAQAPQRGTDLPRARLSNPDFAGNRLDGWAASGDPFVTFDDNGRPGVTTYTARRDAAQGTLSQDFSVDAETSSLIFEVHGGGKTAVSLYDGENVVRSSRGKNSNERRFVMWNLESLRGKRVKLVVADEDPNNYVGVSAFELR